MMETAVQGWRKFMLHMGAWWGVPSAMVWSAVRLGVPYRWWWPLIVVSSIGVIILIREYRSTAKGKQNRAKQRIDTWAKLTGLALAWVSILVLWGF